MTNMMHAKLRSIDWAYNSRAIDKIADQIIDRIDELISDNDDLSSLLTPGQEDEEDSEERDALTHALCTLLAKALIGDSLVKEN